MKKLLRNTLAGLTLAGLLVGCEPNKTVLGPERTAPGANEYVLGSGTSLGKKLPGCATIKDGTIEYGKVGDSSTEIIPIGYDQWGYNYQAHLFNGRYCDNDRVEGGDYCDVNLIMKWSDEWLSNRDCNNDGKLDRGYSCDPVNASSSACPGAWVTNHQSGEYVDGEETYKWNYFVKIVHPGKDAVLSDGMWYTADEEEIGPVIWGAFATIQSVYNDQGTGEHGIEYKSPAAPGLGAYK